MAVADCSNQVVAVPEWLWLVDAGKNFELGRFSSHTALTFTQQRCIIVNSG